jgi:CO/xanthine dehydrogenase FAD-binding subunit
VTIARPRTVADALDALGALPGAQLLAGGTDLMVEINFGRRSPDDIVALRRVAELGAFEVGEQVVLGAGVTYAAVEHDLADELPALAAAARTVGSPQIRNAGTIGGNVGTASPAGDTLPVLAALDASVTLAGPDGDRNLPLDAFITGPKRTAIRPGELIRDVRFRRPRGPQHFLKVGPRNAMVISVACCAVVVDTDRRRLGIGLGSVGPRPLRATAAEDALTPLIDWDALRADREAIQQAAALSAQAAQPITDHRATADYRRHCVGVLVERALTRSLAA